MGVGNIGLALLRYPGFQKQGFGISLSFDQRPQKIGQVVKGMQIEDVSNLEKRVNEEDINLV